MIQWTRVCVINFALYECVFNLNVNLHSASSIVILKVLYKNVRQRNDLQQENDMHSYLAFSLNLSFNDMYVRDQSVVKQILSSPYQFVDIT